MQAAVVYLKEACLEGGKIGEGNIKGWDMRNIV